MLAVFSIMFRFVRLAALTALIAAASPAATLEKLSLDELALRSTAIVIGRAGESRAEGGGALIFTVRPFRVEEQWKGESIDTVRVSLPGGSLNGVVQRFGGVPQLKPGVEYLLFLWRGPSGRTQVTGLSQGVFEVLRSGDAVARVRRRAGGDVLITPGGSREEAAQALETTLSALSGRIKAALGAAEVGGP